MVRSMSKLGGGYGGNGGRPRKFLEKTYHMVDDPSTNEIISWSQTNKSFIIQNPAEFTRLLLRRYFKHNNFSSFVRQLNTYGFRKINHKQWEFAREYFVRDQPHLLGHIRRKKVVHSHSLGESERLALEEEIEKLSIEKASIESDISSIKPRLSARKLHVGNLQQRIEAIENRQKNLRSSFERILQNPKFVEKIYQKIEFIHSLRCTNKRPFPRVAENNFAENDTNLGLMEAKNSFAENDTNLGLMEAGNGFVGNNTNFGVMEAGNGFAVNDTNFGVMGVGNGFAKNDTNFGVMEAGNGFAENDIDFEFIDFENIFADIDINLGFLDVGNMNIFHEEGESINGKVIGEGESSSGFAYGKEGGM